MDDFDFEIEITDLSDNADSQMVLPSNVLALGEIESDDVRVYIKQSVYNALQKYSLSDTTKELGSILIGDYYEANGVVHVVISDYIEAKYTDASAATLTFTHDTWEYIHKVHEKSFPDKKIIGWQHTHPSYGVFLSNYDMFIQENFFNLFFQLAYVIDPVQNLRGFFQWKNGDVQKLKGFYIYDDDGKKFRFDTRETKKDTKQKNTLKSKKAPVAFSIILCLLCVVFAVSIVTLNNRYKRIIADNETVISSQNELIDKQIAQYDELQKYILSDVYNMSTVGEVIEKLESNPYAFSNQDALLEALKNFVQQNADNNNVTFFFYTVKSGDNLYKICAENNIDYNANYSIIVAINSISDPNSIFTGQNLLLPYIITQ